MNDKERQEQITLTVALDRYFIDRLGDCQKHCSKMLEVFDKRLDDIKTEKDIALKVAKDEMERRLEGMNEFRQQLEKREKESVSQSEYKAGHNQVVERLNKLEVRGEKLLDEDDKKDYEKRISVIATQKAVLDGKMIFAMCIVAAVIAVLITIGAKMLSHTG